MILRFFYFYSHCVFSIILNQVEGFQFQSGCLMQKAQTYSKIQFGDWEKVWYFQLEVQVAYTQENISQYQQYILFIILTQKKQIYQITFSLKNRTKIQAIQIIKYIRYNLPLLKNQFILFATYNIFAVYINIQVIMLSFSIYLLAFVLNFCLIASQPCPTNTQLSNFQQITHTLQIISGGNKISESYPFTFSSSYFESLPTAITSINLYNCPSFSQIDYRIDTGVTNTSGTIKFQSTMMNWVEVGVIVWLNARSDIVSGTLTLQNIAKGVSSPVVVNTPRLIPFFSNIHTIYMNFINALTATSDRSQYSVLCEYSSKTEKTYTAKITTGPTTVIKFIKVDYMIYNTNSSIIFMYGSTIQSKLIAKDPIYIKAHRNFAPITNYMFGLDSLALSEKNLMFNMNLDKDMILQISTSTKIKVFRAMIIFLGNFMSQVCSKCSEKYAYGDTCVSSCPQLSYPYEKYADRGASCLTCSKKVNQIINEQKTGCKCMTGYTLTNDYCSESNSTNTIMKRYIRNINGPSLHNYTFPPPDLIDISSNIQNTNSSIQGKKQTGSPVNMKNITNSTTNTIKNTITDNSIIGNKNTTAGLGTGTSGTMDPGANSSKSTLIVVGQKAKKDSDTLDVAQSSTSVNNLTNIITNTTKNMSTIDLTTSNKNSSSPNNQNLSILPLAMNTNQTDQTNTITSTTLIINEIKNSSRVKVSDNTKNNINSVLTINQINNSSMPAPQSMLNASILAISNLSASTIGNTKITKINSPSIPSLSANQPIASSVTLAEALTPEQIGNKCPNNSKFNSTTSKCQCDQFSMQIDQTTCQRCIVGNYKNPQTLVCDGCMGGCQQCTNYTICIKCYAGSYFDPAMGVCAPGTAPTSPTPQTQTPITVVPTSIPNTTSTVNTTKIDTISTGNKSTTTTTVTTTTTITTTTIPSTSINTGVVNSTNSTNSTSNVHQNSSFSTDSGFGSFGDVNGSWGTPSNQDFGNIPTFNSDFSSSGSSNSTIKSNSTTNNNTNNSIIQPPSTPTSIPLPNLPTSCKQNMILVEGVCQCNKLTVLNGTQCTPCPPGQFKYETECFSCSPYCQVCQSPQGCDKCFEGYAFNEMKLCDVPYCKQNQSFLLIACQCDHLTIEDPSGFCKPCLKNQIKMTNKVTNAPECHDCSVYIDHCDICQSNQKCTQCLPNFILASDKNCECKEPNKIVNDGGCCPANSTYVVANRTCVSQSLPTPTPTPVPSPTVANNTTNSTTVPIPVVVPVVPPSPPKCKEFELLQGLNCVCDLQSVNISGKCQHCGVGLFKYPGNTVECLKCPDNCELCFSIQACERCKEGYSFDATTKKCQNVIKPLHCSTNEQIINNKCQCIKQTTRNTVSGQCEIKCPSGKFLIENECFDCTEGCKSCTLSHTSGVQCVQCLAGLQLNQQTFFCCKTHQFYDKTSKICSCKTGFYLIEGICDVCNPGYIYNSTQQRCQPPPQPSTQNITTINTTQATTTTTTTTQNTSTINVLPAGPIIPTQNCKADEQLNGNICQCKNQSLRMPDGSCRCPDGQFNNNKKCQLCVSNCVKCNNFSMCNECQPGYTGNQCQSCSKDYNKIAGLVPIRCEKKPCGNFIIDKQEQCDDGNSASSDGCSSQCLIQNGYACQNQLLPCTSVIQILKKQSDSITSTGIFSSFTYSSQELQPNFKEVVILNGTKPSNMRVIKRNSPSDPYQKTVKVFLDYCGTIPNQNITVKYVTNSSKGIVNYVSEYNLGQKLIIPRTTVSRAIKQDQYLH